MTIRFDDRVAIVTGAGAGLGRAHALGLAALGARVVVNDLGVARDGVGRSAEQAQRVVAEIMAAGGDAMADGADVSDPSQVEHMVAAAMSRWGRVDVLVNNAGILRDRSFAKLPAEDFRKVVDVHLMGSTTCTKAVWDIMRAQSYGRIVFTTSASGLYGNFGQSNYAAAKMALVGLMNVLHAEGAKYDIRVNCLAPTAATRMTEELLPEQQHGRLRPETITPGLLYLVSQDAPSKMILSAGGGVFARTIIRESEGVYLDPERRTPDAVKSVFEMHADETAWHEIPSAFDQTRRFLAKVSLPGVGR